VRLDAFQLLAGLAALAGLDAFLRQLLAVLFLDVMGSTAASSSPATSSPS
jgi:hypothetical protein